MATSPVPPVSLEAPLRALLWDVDGTLAETELDGHRRAFNRAFADEKLGWHWDIETYLQMLRISGGRERMRCHGRDRGDAVSEAQIERLQHRKQQHYEQLVRSGGIALRPGVRRLIGEAAAAGLQQVIVTTSGRASVQALLETTGADLASCFDFWVCGEDVEYKKPAPEGYQQAIAQLGLEPAEAVAIEDSRNGLEAATGAGLACLVTLSDSSRWEAGPDGCEGFEAALAVLDGLGDAGCPLRQHRGPIGAPELVTLSWLRRLRTIA